MKKYEIVFEAITTMIFMCGMFAFFWFILAVFG